MITANSADVKVQKSVNYSLSAMESRNVRMDHGYIQSAPVILRIRHNKNWTQCKNGTVRNVLLELRRKKMMKVRKKMKKRNRRKMQRWNKIKMKTQRTKKMLRMRGAAHLV
jgi:hypothetical protein